MTSKELRNAGYKANNGFHDQKTALAWVKKFIGGFGGNPEELTVCGESAGGCKYIAVRGARIQLGAKELHWNLLSSAMAPTCPIATSTRAFWI
jgi:hypothetical protein